MKNNSRVSCRAAFAFEFSNCVSNQHASLAAGSGIGHAMHMPDVYYNFMFTLPIRTRACLRLLLYEICGGGKELARARAFTQMLTISL